METLEAPPKEKTPKELFAEARAKRAEAASLERKALNLRDHLPSLKSVRERLDKAIDKADKIVKPLAEKAREFEAEAEARTHGSVTEEAEVLLLSAEPEPEPQWVEHEYQVEVQRREKLPWYKRFWNWCKKWFWKTVVFVIKVLVFADGSIDTYKAGRALAKKIAAAL